MFAIITAAFEDRLLLFYMVVMTNMRADVSVNLQDCLFEKTEYL